MIGILIIPGIFIGSIWTIAILNWCSAKGYSTSIPLRYKEFRAIYAVAPDRWCSDLENATYLGVSTKRDYYIYFSPLEWLIRYIPFYIHHKRRKTKEKTVDALEGFLVNVQKDIDNFSSLKPHCSGSLYTPCSRFLCEKEGEGDTCKL